MIEKAQEIIRDNIAGIKMNQSRQRRRLVERYVDFYGGENTAQYIADRFKLEAFQEIPPACFNFTKKFIDRMSRIYVLGAQRTVNDSYNEMIVDKDNAFKHIEKMTRLIGTIATKVELLENDNSKMKFDYEPIYYFDPIFDDDYLNPVAILYPIIGAGSDTFGQSPLVYAYWDDTQNLILDGDGKVIEEFNHDYGFLPFVFTHREHQIDDFFVCGAYDIVSCNEMVNILLTEANLGLRFSMFGQHTITGLYSDDTVQRAGSDELLILPEGADYKILSPEANIRDAIDLTKNMLDLCAQNNHLSISFAETSSDRPTSGIALKIKDLERFEDYQDDLDLWNKYENQYYQLERNLAGLFNISLPETLGIDFNEPEYPKTVQDEVMMKTWMLENNLTTHAEILMGYNKDLTIEQAQEIVDNNKETNGQGTEQEEEQPRGTIFDRLRLETPEA